MQFGLKEHLTTILRHWGKILLVMFGAILVTGSIAFLSSKVYVSESRILILNSSPVDRASRNNYPESGGAQSSPQEQVLTQVQIIQSPALAEKLAIQLGPERVMDEMRWRWDWLRELPGKIKDRILLTLYSWDQTANLLRMIGIRRPVAEDGPPIGPAREKIMDNLHAEAITKTDMFGVGFGAPSPEFAAEALNGMIDIYVSHVVSLRRPVDTASIAQQEAERLESVLAEAEQELRAFASEHDILSIERQKNLLLDRRSRMQDELAAARRAALETDQKLASIETQIETLPRNESISVTTRPNPVVDRLRDRLSQLQTELQRYVPGSAAATRLRREIENISRQIDDQAQAVTGAQTVGTSSLYQQLKNTMTLEVAELEALEVRREFLLRELENVDTELRTLDSHELTYRQLARAVDAKEEAYRYALQKREETAIQTQITEPNQAKVVPVEPGAIPDDPAAPRRGRLLALGLVAGLLAGIGLAYLLEFARRTIATPREAELALGLPVLAVTERYGLFSRHLGRTRREMRRFAVWLMHQRETGAPFRILFSAAHRNSGQSGLITELARALQQQGVNVLVMSLEVAKKAVETGAPKPAETDADTPDDGTRNDVLTVTGPAWEMARRVRTELDKRAGEDEVVLVDAPDIASFPEQAALAELVDAVLPVVEADRTRLSETIAQLADIRAMETQVPGIAFTKRRQAKSSWAFSWMALTRRKAGERAA